MKIGYKQLKGLDEERILTLVEPILASHRVDAVELMWRGGKDGQVLLLTLEKPDSQRSGEGITIDLCSEIARQLSQTLDESALISANYRLEVGSPGVERALYSSQDFRRFAGQEVKVKLKEPMTEDGFVGARMVRGTLFGVEEDERVVVETERGNISLPFDKILSARLVFSWNQPSSKTARSKAKANAGRSRAKTERSK